MKRFITIFLFLFFICSLRAAPIKKFPVIRQQPNGTIFHCYTSGDENFHWLHDEIGNIIVQDTITGYYRYVTCVGDSMLYDVVCSDSIISIRQQSLDDNSCWKNHAIVKQKRLRMESYDMSRMESSSASFNGTINNIVVFVRFNDQTEFSTSKLFYDSIFNGIGESTISLEDYYFEASYETIDINSSFYPQTTGAVIASYCDSQPRDYYDAYNALTNTIGYKTEEEIREREHLLIHNAIASIKSQIPSTLNIDNNSDGNVDNICFIIKGETGDEILWPHQWSLFSHGITINGKVVNIYNVQIEDYLLDDKGVGVLAHEFGHTLGAPDLYHAAGDAKPVDMWELMAWEENIPQHMSTYVKYKYLGFIPSIPEITESGTYTLNPILSSTQNCYKIPIFGTNKYFVLEYRKKMGKYESVLPNEGLLVYRINPTKRGNYNAIGYGGRDDEVYCFRLNGTYDSDGLIRNAPLSFENGRIVFNYASNPYSFDNEGYPVYVSIKNISQCGESITFDVRFCDGDDIILSNENISSLVNANSTISTIGDITILAGEEVILEAGSEVLLNSGFSVELGGELDININPCGTR